MRKNRILVFIIIAIFVLGDLILLMNPDIRNRILGTVKRLSPVKENTALTGFIEAEETNLTSTIAALCGELLVAEGDWVEQDQPLLVLSSPTLAAKLEVARQGVRVAEARLEMLIVEPRQVDLEVAQAGVDQAQAVLDGASLALEDAHQVEPYDLRVLQIKLALAGVEKSSAGVSLAQLGLDQLKRGASDEDIKTARAALEAAQAELNSIQEQMNQLTIRSPIDGSILEIFIHPGEGTMPGKMMIQIADNRTMHLTVFVPAVDLDLVQIGTPVTVHVDTSPDQAFQGKVTQIAEKAEFTQRNTTTSDERAILVYAVEIEIPNTGLTLKPGLPARVVLEAQQ